MDSSTRGTVLVAAAATLLVLTLGVSAAIAPDAAVSGDNRSSETLVGVQGGGPGWHKFGRVNSYNGTDLAWQAADADSYFDVTKLDNGSVVAAFMDSGYDDCGQYESPCTHTGYRIIDPNGGDPKVVSEFSFPVGRPSNTEVHDAEPLGDGRFVLTDMDSERVVVVEDGEITWQWNASDYYDVPADGAGSRDWLHINDVDAIDEDTYLVSVRNANQLLVVRQGEGVVEVINEDTDTEGDGECTHNRQLADTDGDGDVNCGDISIMNEQHNPQWLGGEPGGEGEAAVLVADSSNDRVVELHRVDGEWEVAWTLETAGGIDLRWPRDADRLENGNTLVTDTLNRRILEVDENGTVLWSITTEYVPYEADRVPQGEEPSGDWYGSENPDAGGSASSVPFLSEWSTLLRGIFPGLPFWYGGVQFGVTIVAFLLALVGVVEIVRSRL
jgi:hypothetical protein